MSMGGYDQPADKNYRRIQSGNVQTFESWPAYWCYDWLLRVNPCSSASPSFFGCDSWSVRGWRHHSGVSRTSLRGIWYPKAKSSVSKLPSHQGDHLTILKCQKSRASRPYETNSSFWHWRKSTSVRHWRPIRAIILMKLWKYRVTPNTCPFHLKRAHIEERAPQYVPQSIRLSILRWLLDFENSGLPLIHVHSI